MRFLPHLLAAVLATTTLTTSIAFACGGYAQYNPPPRVLAVAQHHPEPQPGHYTYTRGRPVVVLDQTSAGSTPAEVTLVGISGTRVVKTQGQVAMTARAGARPNRVGLEVPIGDYEHYSIAIPGRATDAKWHTLGTGKASAKTRWWLAQQGIEHAAQVRVRTIKGVELIGYRTAGKWHFIARQGDRQIGLAADARPLGAVTTAGRTFLVFSTSEQIGLLELPATTKA
jgi:hypothetical protein